MRNALGGSDNGEAEEHTTQEETPLIIPTSCDKQTAGSATPSAQSQTQASRVLA